jgi:hypothetical protein
MVHQSFKTFQEAFLGINKTIIESPIHVTDSRLGFMNEIPGFSYSVEDMSTYEFPNSNVGRLDYNYANLFYEWMIGGCTDNSTILEQYPTTARFMEKPKSEDLPTNFNTFYGPRILEQLPFVEKELKLNFKKVRLMAGLIYVNVATLHHFPYCNLLYYLGKQMVGDYITDKEK